MSTPEQPTPPQRSTIDIKKQLKSIAILVVLFAATYFISQAIQTYLGKRAAQATGLPAIALESALRQSANSNKPVFLNVSAYWCPACRKLDNDVLSNPQVKQKIEDDYIFTRIDIDSDEGQKVARRYNVKGTPSLIILNSEGDVLRWLQTSFRPERFIKQL